MKERSRKEKIKVYFLRAVAWLITMYYSLLLLHSYNAPYFEKLRGGGVLLPACPYVTLKGVLKNITRPIPFGLEREWTRGIVFHKIISS